MVAATVTYFPTNMPGFTRGTAIARDNYTLDTNIESNNLSVTIQCASGDCIAGITSISAAGIVTLALTKAGVSKTQDETIYWFAVKQPGTT